jgi:hypothetical protein
MMPPIIAVAFIFGLEKDALRILAEAQRCLSLLFSLREPVDLQ